MNRRAARDLADDLFDSMVRKVGDAEWTDADEVGAVTVYPPPPLPPAVLLDMAAQGYVHRSLL